MSCEAHDVHPRSEQGPEPPGPRRARASEAQRGRCGSLRGLSNMATSQGVSGFSVPQPMDVSMVDPPVTKRVDHY